MTHRSGPPEGRQLWGLVPPWLWLSSSLCLCLSVSLSRCNKDLTLDALLQNNAVLQIHYSIITKADFTCKCEPDTFRPLCVHLYDLQIFGLKEIAGQYMICRLLGYRAMPLDRRLQV